MFLLIPRIIIRLDWPLISYYHYYYYSYHHYYYYYYYSLPPSPPILLPAPLSLLLAGLKLAPKTPTNERAPVKRDRSEMRTKRKEDGNKNTNRNVILLGSLTIVVVSVCFVSKVGSSTLELQAHGRIGIN